MRRLYTLFFLFLLCSCVQPTILLPHEGLQNEHAMKQARRKLYAASNLYTNELEHKVGSVIHRLLRSTGQELCDRKLKADIGVDFGRALTKKETSSGMSYMGDEVFIKDYNEMFGFISGNVYLTQVYKGSAADKAGLRRFDQVVSLYGIPIPTGSGSIKSIKDIINTSSKSGEPVTMEVKRGKKVLSFKFEPDQICPYDWYFDRSMRQINAFTNGKNLYVTYELVDFFGDDEAALAAVVGHELGHAVLGHPRANEINNLIGTTLGSLLDIFTGTVNTSNQFGDMAGKMYSQQQELESDYLSVYFLALAGYDYHQAVKAQVLLTLRDRGSLYGKETTHPKPQKRYILLKDTADEIDLKKTFGEDILPNFKDHNDYLDDKKDI